MQRVRERAAGGARGKGHPAPWIEATPRGGGESGTIRLNRVVTRAHSIGSNPRTSLPLPPGGKREAQDGGRGERFTPPPTIPPLTNGSSAPLQIQFVTRYRWTATLAAPAGAGSAPAGWRHRASVSSVQRTTPNPHRARTGKGRTPGRRSPASLVQQVSETEGATTSPVSTFFQRTIR